MMKCIPLNLYAQRSRANNRRKKKRSQKWSIPLPFPGACSSNCEQG